jgi:MFS family permease
VFAISFLGFLGDVRTAIIAQLLMVVGILVLAFFTPEFNTMLIFLFIHSLGMHMFFTLRDAIGLSLVKDSPSIGTHMSRFSATSMAFSMLASLLIFLGFRFGFFSFVTPVKAVFVISGVLALVVALMFVVLSKSIKKPEGGKKKSKLVLRKRYLYYYILAILRGSQKQIAIVYGPWILIDLLSRRADTMAALGIVGSLIGIFFIQVVGKCVDKFGVKKLLYAEAVAHIVIYIAYGLLAMGVYQGFLPVIGIPVFIAMTLIILDRMSMQMNVVKTVYLKSIIVDDSEISKTISMGISLDHIVSVGAAMLGGFLWMEYGPQYIFFLAAAMSLGNIWVAAKIGTEAKE